MPPAKRQIDEDISERVARCEQKLSFIIGAVTVLRNQMQEIFRELEILPKSKRKHPVKTVSKKRRTQDCLNS